MPRFFGLLRVFRRDRLGADFLPVVAVEVVRLARDWIDDPLERRLFAHRDLEFDRVMAELLFEHRGDPVVVRAGVVHLVDESDARNAVTLHLPVDRDRLTLDALARVEHEDRAVEDAEGAFDLDREVDVPGGVDDVDVVRRELLLRAAPHAVRRRRLDRDPLFPLEIHRVHFRADAVFAAHFVDLVDPPRVKEDALGQGRFARVDVRRDADVANAFEGDACGHGSFFLGAGLTSRSGKCVRVRADCGGPHSLSGPRSQ